jgi:hypothetical protein
MPVEALVLAARRAYRGPSTTASRSSPLPGKRSRSVPGRSTRSCSRGVVLTAPEARRAASTQAAAPSGRPNRLHHHLRHTGSRAEGAATGAASRTPGRRVAQRPAPAVGLGRVHRHRGRRPHRRMGPYGPRLARWLVLQWSRIDRPRFAGRLRPTRSGAPHTTARHRRRSPEAGPFLRNPSFIANATFSIGRRAPVNAVCPRCVQPLKTYSWVDVPLTQGGPVRRFRLIFKLFAKTPRTSATSAGPSSSSSPAVSTPIH